MGIEATRQIREFNSKVIIIAQTAYALTVTEKRLLNQGVMNIFAKPLNLTVLNNLIKKLFT